MVQYQHQKTVNFDDIPGLFFNPGKTKLTKQPDKLLVQAYAGLYTKEKAYRLACRVFQVEIHRVDFYKPIRVSMALPDAAGSSTDKIPRLRIVVFAIDGIPAAAGYHIGKVIVCYGMLRQRPTGSTFAEDRIGNIRYKTDFFLV
jgi:hypothetical protein